MSIRKTLTILSFLIAVSVITAGYGVWAIGNLGPSIAHAADPPPANGPRGKISALGRLEPEDEVTEIGVPGGDRIGKILVAPGQKVKADEPLAQMKSSKQRGFERDLVAAQLAEAKNRHKAQTDNGAAVVAEAESAVKAAESGVREAESALKDAETGLAQSEEVEPKDVLVQESRVKIAKLVLDLAKRDLETYEQMMKTDSGTRWKLDRQLLAVSQATEEVVAAETLLERAKTQRDVNGRRAKAQVEVAKARLEASKSALDSAKARLEAQKSQVAVLIAAIPVSSLQENLKLAEERLDDTIIKAPRAGTILSIIAHEGEASGLKPLLKFGNTDQMFAVAEVYETDISLVKKGQDATITSSALKKPIKGKVERIGLLIHKNDVLNLDPTAASDARVVEVRIKLETDAEVSQLTNLQVDIEIDTK